MMEPIDQTFMEPGHGPWCLLDVERKKVLAHGKLEAVHREYKARPEWHGAAILTQNPSWEGFAKVLPDPDTLHGQLMEAREELDAIHALASEIRDTDAQDHETALSVALLAVERLKTHDADAAVAWDLLHRAKNALVFALCGHGTQQGNAEGLSSLLEVLRSALDEGTLSPMWQRARALLAKLEEAEKSRDLWAADAKREAQNAQHHRDKREAVEVFLREVYGFAQALVNQRLPHSPPEQEHRIRGQREVGDRLLEMIPRRLDPQEPIVIELPGPTDEQRAYLRRILEWEEDSSKPWRVIIRLPKGTRR